MQTVLLYLKMMIAIVPAFIVVTYTYNPRKDGLFVVCAVAGSIIHALV